MNNERKIEEKYFFDRISTLWCCVECAMQREVNKWKTQLIEVRHKIALLESSYGQKPTNSTCEYIKVESQINSRRFLFIFLRCNALFYALRDDINEWEIFVCVYKFFFLSGNFSNGNFVFWCLKLQPKNTQNSILNATKRQLRRPDRDTMIKIWYFDIKKKLLWIASLGFVSSKQSR